MSINYFSEQHVFHSLKQKILHDVSKKFSCPPPNPKLITGPNRFTPQSCFRCSCKLLKDGGPCCLLPLWQKISSSAAEKGEVKHWTNLTLLLWEKHSTALLSPLVYAYQLVGLWHFGALRYFWNSITFRCILSHLICGTLLCSTDTIAHEPRSRKSNIVSSLPLLTSSFSSTLNTCETEPGFE